MASTYSDNFNSTTFGADGVVGLGFKEISPFNATPFFETLVDQGQLEEPVFGFFLAESDSEFIIGGRDSSRFSGNLTYVNVNRTVRIFEVSLAFVLTQTRHRVFGRPSLMLFQLTEITFQSPLRMQLSTRAPPLSLVTKSLSLISIARSPVRPSWRTPPYGQVRFSRC